MKNAAAPIPRSCGVGRALFLPNPKRPATPIGRTLPRPACLGFGRGLSILILALRHEPGSQALREESKRRPCVCSLHEGEHGGSFVPNPRFDFTFEEKTDARRC